MTIVSDDRWTCPHCNRTTISAQPTAAGVRRELRRAQDLHGRRHRAELTSELRAVAR